MSTSSEERRVIVHDINNSLSICILNLEKLKKDLTDPQSIERINKVLNHLQMIESSAQKIR